MSLPHSLDCGHMAGRPGLLGSAHQFTLTPLLSCVAGRAGRRGGRGTRQALLACALGRALGRALRLHAVAELHQLLPQQVGSSAAYLAPAQHDAKPNLLPPHHACAHLCQHRG